MSTAVRVQQKASGWRKAMGDVKALAQPVIEYLEGRGVSIPAPGGVMVPGADVVRRLLHLIDSAAGNVRAEERAAFDQYLAALVSESTSVAAVAQAATVAEAMLAERRRRFGGDSE